MNTTQSSTLVTEVLLNGPPDGHRILQYAQSNGLWEALYLASRSSDHALQWRNCFGHQTVSSIQSPTCILELAVRMLMDQADESHPNVDPAISSFAVKLIANCCADNDPNRRVVLQTGGLLPLIKMLEAGADPNVLVPTIYNICVDLEDPAENIRYRSTSSQEGLSITIAEERLARTDVPTNSIYSGIITFLKPDIVANCGDDIREYLADLIDMSARPAAAAHEGLADPRDGDFGYPISRLLASDGGELLAKSSPKCRISIIRALIALCTSEASKKFIASTGTIFDIAQMGDYHSADTAAYEGDADEMKENQETFANLQTVVLKLVYEVCQLPQFSSPPKYGVARHSMQIISDDRTCSQYRIAIAFIMLYNFVDNNARAGLLASENLIPCLAWHLQHQETRMVLHPALGLATKLAVAWSLRRDLYAAGVIQTVKRLLLGTDMGYDIPQNAVTFLELMIKGHPSHVQALLSDENGSSIMQDIFILFNTGHDAICLEIGRLVIELCATLAQQNTADIAWTDTDLEAVLKRFQVRSWSDIFIFMGTKAQATDPVAAQRVWFALGLLSSGPVGKQIVLKVLQNTALTGQMEDLKTQPESWPAQNIRFMLYNVKDLQGADLDRAMNQMSLS